MGKGFDISKADEMSSAEIGQYLKDKEKLFAKEYLKDMNGTQAAIRAGYKAGKNNSSAAVQASRLLRNEKVSAYRRALIKENLSDKDLSKESIALKLFEIYSRCMEKEPVMEYNSDLRSWEESGTWKFDSRGATKALEGLTKLLGYDAPVKAEVSIDSYENNLRELEMEDE